MFAHSLARRASGQHVPLWALAQRSLGTSSATTAEAASAAPPNPDTMEVFVNGESVTVPKNYSVLQACDAAGIDIPRCGSMALVRTTHVMVRDCVSSM